MDFAWQIKQFTQLTNIELYAIWQLRETVFVVEQQAIYLDADSADLSALHILGRNEEDELAAYARVLCPETDGVVHFGRVCVSQKYRKSGLGKKLIQFILAELVARYPNYQIIISAQQYLIEFYESFDFRVIGDGYVTEDKIPHIDMQLELAL